MSFFRRAESKSGLSSGLSLFLHWVLDMQCFLSVFREEPSFLDKTRLSDFPEYPLPLQPGAY